jgi:hypothetical protein
VDPGSSAFVGIGVGTFEEDGRTSRRRVQVLNPVADGGAELRFDRFAT